MDPNSQKIDDKNHEELRSLKMTPKWSQEGDVRGQEGRQPGLGRQQLLDPRPWGRVGKGFLVLVLVFIQ